MLSFLLSKIGLFTIGFAILIIIIGIMFVNLKIKESTIANLKSEISEQKADIEIFKSNEIKYNDLIEQMEIGRESDQLAINGLQEQIYSERENYQKVIDSYEEIISALRDAFIVSGDTIENGVIDEETSNHIINIINDKFFNNGM